MTTHATAAPATTAARRYSESMHVLVETETRAVILGLAIIDAQDGGYRPKEGDALRQLLDAAIGQLYDTDKRRYADALRRGREELARRQASRTQ